MISFPGPLLPLATIFDLGWAQNGAQFFRTEWSFVLGVEGKIDAAFIQAAMYATGPDGNGSPSTPKTVTLAEDPTR